MNQTYLLAPVAVPLLVALVMVLCSKRQYLMAGLSILSALLQLGAGVGLLFGVLSSGYVTLPFGSWQAPFGIVFAADTLSALLVLVTALLSLGTALYAPFGTGPEEHRLRFFVLREMVFAGVYGSFLTGDLFNLFVWFEVMLISSFVLLSLGSSRQAIGGAFKYVLLNLFSSTLFLSALALIYGKLGTLNLAHIASRAEAFADSPLLLGAAVLLLTAFGIKSAVFPLHYWLPASYHTSAPLISAVLGGLLTKVGVYALLRIFTLVFPLEGSWIRELLLVLSLLTMIVGVLGAASEWKFRRILSFHVMSQVGYMTLALAVATPLAVAACIFYILHHMLVKTNLFMLGGLAEHMSGSPDIREQGGLWRSHPLLAFVFLIPALSLAGVPPLSGFFAKLLVLQSLIDVSLISALLIALAVGMATLYSMVKVWNESFWKGERASEQDRVPREVPRMAVAAVALLALTTLGFGIGAAEVYELCERAAGELMNPEGYINAVLARS